MPNLPKVGQVAPDFETRAVDGRMVRLAEYARPVGLVFLRHLA